MRKTKGEYEADKYVGARIRMLRIMRGKSQTDLADGVGLTFQQIQKYEKGVNRVSASRLQQFASMLGVEVPFFFEGAPGQLAGIRANDRGAAAIYVGDFLVSRDGHRIINAFRRISNTKVRRTIVALVEQLAGRVASSA